MPARHSRTVAVKTVLLAILVVLLSPEIANAAPNSLKRFDYEVVGVTNQAVGAGQTAVAVAECPAGKKPLGGGVYAGSSALRVVASFPLGAPSDPTGWFGTVANEGADDSIFDVYVICAKDARVSFRSHSHSLMAAISTVAW